MTDSHTFCCTSTTPTARDGLQVRSFATAAEAREAGWDKFRGLPPFLSTSWLSALCATEQGGAGGPATALQQVVDAAMDVELQCISQRLPVREMRLGTHVRPSIIAHALGANAYQLGQALFSGPAYASSLSQADAVDLLATVAERAGSQTPGAWLLKDLPTAPSDADWHPLEALPEMAIALPPTWRTFDDYLEALPSKYRRRARRARRMGSGLEVQQLDVDAADGFGESIQALYDDLMARTPYVPFVVESGYVPRLKALRPDGTTVLGYFDGDRMVGFATLLLDGHEAMAHLAAVDPAYNASHQLYLNLLYDLLAAAIRLGATRLNYGRTATTIKSSVGAVPVYYASAARHTGRVRNGLLRRVVPLVVDAADRHQLVQRPLG